MKRSETLAPLSRDHHQSLILAQLLKKSAPVYKGLPVTVADKATYAKDQFDHDIKIHFEKEEQVLDEVKGFDPVIDQLVNEIRREHKKIGELFNAMDSKPNLVEALDELGRMLEAHIRKEERQLFPLLEQYCPEDIMQRVYGLLH